MRYRRFAALFSAFLLAGCSSLDDMLPTMPSMLAMPDIGLSSVGIGKPAAEPAKTTGLAVSDEPFAAQAGASILSEGGSAADAVAAMFFTLSVTYPVAAGLGGGGICLVRDTRGRTAEFDFLARAANSGGVYAVPGAVAGFYDMQKAFGTLPWQRDVASAEAYAATGFPISHVLAQRLAVTANIIAQDPPLAAEFMAGGALKPEGSVAINQPLSATLSAIRLGGVDGFYAGPVADSIVAASSPGGRPLTQAELSAFHSTQTSARILRLGEVNAAMPGASTGAGAFIASLLSNAGGGAPEVAAVNGLRRALDSFHVQSVPPDLGATGFAALDADGQAAACAVTLNGPFGSGHSADAGMVLAASPAQPAGISGAFLTPMIVTDSANRVALAGAGSGGPNGSAAMAYALLKRASGAGIMRPGDLRSTGLAPFATVNTIACQDGLCVALPDPGGNGLGSSVDQPVASN
jgi:gamma-glutamyltranspeptidase/glutathione hydrolase